MFRKEVSCNASAWKTYFIQFCVQRFRECYYFDLFYIKLPCENSHPTSEKNIQIFITFYLVSKSLLWTKCCNMSSTRTWKYEWINQQRVDYFLSVVHTLFILIFDDTLEEYTTIIVKVFDSRQWEGVVVKNNIKSSAMWSTRKI